MYLVQNLRLIQSSPVNSYLDDVECPHPLAAEASSDGPLLPDHRRHHCLNIARYFGNLE